MQYRSEDVNIVFAVPELICVLTGYLCSRNSESVCWREVVMAIAEDVF